MNIKDIDKHLSASGVIKLIEMKQKESERRMKTMLRSDGIAKKGCSIGVEACAQSQMAAKKVISWIEEYLRTVEE